MGARWKALDLAPSLVEKAKGVWQSVANRGARPSAARTTPGDGPAEARIPALERRVAELEGEAAASFEVVGAIAQQHSQLAEQHSELVGLAEALLARTRVLAWAVGALAVLLPAAIAILLSR